MGLDQLEDVEAYERRYSEALQALNTIALPVHMMRRIALARKKRAAGGLVLEGDERLSAARRIGLLASSMNPLTRAHVALAETARETGHLDALCWVATTVTVDKEHVERATLADRLIEASVYAHATGDGLLLLKGGLYVEQAREAHSLLGQDTAVVLIVGYDKVVQIFDPRYYADRDAALGELFAEAELLVAPRTGYTEGDLQALLAQPENRQFAERVRYCPLPERYQSDSSTEARALAEATGNRSPQLRKLLAPEGLALTMLGAYAPLRPAEPTDLGDIYSARQALLNAFSDIKPAYLYSLRPNIGLMRLVRWSGEDTARGAALRAWARSRSHHTLEGLWAALEAV